MKNNNFQVSYLESCSENTHQSIIDVIIPDSICPIPADDKSHDTVWFIH